MDLWDRREDETDQAWRAFVAYRDAGLHRKFADSKLPFADTAKLAVKYEWAARTRAYDAWSEEVRKTAYAESLKASAAKMAQDQQEIVSMGLAVAVNGIRALLLRQQESPTAEVVPQNVLVRLAEMSIKAAQLLQGKPTDELKVSVADLSPEELALLRRK